MKTQLSSVAAVDTLIRKGKGRKKGKKGRKIGRYGKSPACIRYRSEQRWEANRRRRVWRHLRREPSDRQARSWFAEHGGIDAASMLAGLPTG